MLKNCKMMEQLVLFIREAFKVHYIAYNVKAIKKLDKIMMDFKVPSRS
ncbi:13096_t:CDS:1, partial [Funneliformis geosporum]